MSSVLRRRKAKDASKVKGVTKEVAQKVKKVEKVVKNEAKKLEKAVELRTEKKPKGQLSRPSGRIPQAMVTARHGTTMKSRRGRGFSLGELFGVGLTPRMATGWGLRIDSRRRSVIGSNVESLKGWSAHGGATVAVEKEAKKVEEEIVEAGREVEREAVIVEKEAVKAGKAIKKEAKKAERAVKGKVKRPKTRAKKKP